MVGDPPVIDMNSKTLQLLGILFWLPLPHTPHALAEPDPLALYRRWCRSPSPQLRIQAARSLRGHESDKSRVALFTLLGDEHPAVRAAARYELVRRPPQEGPALARAILGLRDADARLEGLRAVLDRREDPTPFARDPSPPVQCRALATGRAPPAVCRLLRKSRDVSVRALALESLDDPAEAERDVRSSSEVLRIAAARVRDDAGALGRLLKDRSWRVRLAAIRRVEALRRRELVAPLIEVLAGKPGRVRARAAQALENLTRLPFGENVRKWRTFWSERGADFLMPKPHKVKPKRKGHSTAAIRFRRLPITSRRLCFIIDASRSMSKPAPGKQGKSRWELVVRDLKEVLAHLPSDARFNVVLFRTGVEAWRPRLVPATRAMKRSCTDWIDKASPAGWTNLFDALDMALRDNAVDAVYVLTDGVPSRGAETRREAILDEIRYMNHLGFVHFLVRPERKEESGVNRAE